MSTTNPPPNPSSPAAVRATRPGWRDPRLALGVALVAGSALLGARLLGSADDTVAVWSLRADAVAGQAVTAAALEPVRVRFSQGPDADRYVPADALPDGTVLLRDVGAGELLPRAALGRAGETDLVEVAVTVPAAAVPATLEVGGKVDVWATEREASRADLVLKAVPVLALPTEGSAWGATGEQQVIVGLDREHQHLLPEALARLAGGAESGTVVLAVRATR